MFHPKRISVGLVLGGVLLLLTACDGPPPKPPAFNDRIAWNNKKWNNAVLEFKTAIAPLSQGGNVTSRDAQAAYDKLADVFKQVRRTSKHIPAPLGSPTGADFLAKYKEYMDVQDDIMQDEMKKILSVVADNNLNNKQKWDAINKIYWDIEQHEKPSREALHSAASSFCSAHNLSASASFNPPPKK